MGTRLTVKSSKHILYVGQLWEGATSYDRLRALRELGCSLLEFDVSEYLVPRSRIESILAHHLNYGRAINELNRDLLEFAYKQETNITHIWIDKGKWITPETLQQLRSCTGAMLVHYSLDPQLVFNRSRQFTGSIPHYDVLFTTKRFELDLYLQVGAAHVYLVDQSYDHTRFFPRALSAEDQRKYGSDLCFIGHHEDHYGSCLSAALQSKCQARVWGPGWRSQAAAYRWGKQCVPEEAVWGEQYPIALNGAKIALGLLTKRYQETTTTRTFEIPACGTFMLAERTDDHLRLFEEGIEAEFFASAEELVDKVRYFLAHPNERAHIALAGYNRCLQSGYSNVHRMRQALDLIDEVGEKKVRREQSLQPMETS